MPLYGVQSLKEVIRLQEEGGTNQSQDCGLCCEVSNEGAEATGEGQPGAAQRNPVLKNPQTKTPNPNNKKKIKKKSESNGTRETLPLTLLCFDVVSVLADNFREWCILKK